MTEKERLKCRKCAIEMEASIFILKQAIKILKRKSKITNKDIFPEIVDAVIKKYNIKVPELVYSKISKLIK